MTQGGIFTAVAMVMAEPEPTSQTAKVSMKKK
jgi:hypothetical protein